jgi:hypothetical protein
MRAPGACRIAPEEVMVVGSLAGDLAAAVRTVDDGALIVDASEGWAGLTLAGDTDAAIRRLSELEPPDGGFLQGEVAGVPARVLTEPGRMLLLVPAMFEAHVRGRILRDCGSLGLQEVAS